MAKRRILKKAINAHCSEMFAECVAVRLFHKNITQESLDPIMTRVLSLQMDMLERVNHVEPGSTRLFFKKLEEDFCRESEDIHKALADLL
ncbi:MAG: hypothetical protein J6K41_10240 [Paraprevotella sp.]|nr:hypothetical protein [Paraprevotella sp.]